MFLSVLYKMAYVYILESSESGRYYIGSCKDLEKRLKRHNTGQVLATRKFRPYQIVFNKEYTNDRDARFFEAKLKKLKRRDYIQKTIKNKDIRIRATSSSGRAIDS
jgi:putative endonuclease